jgi:hypothetical protein
VRVLGGLLGVVAGLALSLQWLGLRTIEGHWAGFMESLIFVLEHTSLIRPEWPKPVTEGGLSYKQTGLSQKDMDFLEQRKWNREEIMAAFKVPKLELGLYDDVNFAPKPSRPGLSWTGT